MIDSSKGMSKPSALYVYQQTLGLLLAGSQQAPMVSIRERYPLTLPDWVFAR